MITVPQAQAKTRAEALRDERSDLLRRIADLTERAEGEALAGRMDRWAITRQSIRPLAARLAEVHEALAVIRLATHPTRTQSWAVER